MNYMTNNTVIILGNGFDIFLIPPTGNIIKTQQHLLSNNLPKSV